MCIRDRYAYEPGTLYQVYAQPMRITDIALEPGEKILGEPASGDVVRWLLALGKSMERGVEQWHVYLKPTRPELETNLAINTDRRSYLLELHSYADTYICLLYTSTRRSPKPWSIRSCRPGFSREAAAAT